MLDTSIARSRKIRSEAIATYDLGGGAGSFPVLVLLGYGFLIAGLAFKATLVPFHAWAVDVYDGAPRT